MATRPQSKGKCTFCGRELTKGGLTRHLSSCIERQKAIEVANQGAGQEQPLIHLQVRDAYLSDFWLHLEMNGRSSLVSLDGYLRAIWLECCGHLSQFFLGGWAGTEISDAAWAERVFAPGTELTHIYDFGTSSETKIKVAGIRRGKPLTRHPIVLMARNNQPVSPCLVCGKPSTWLCLECLIEVEATGYLCDEHVEEHPHHQYGEPVPLVNSPRMGLCAYCGPADPPY